MSSWYELLEKNKDMLMGSVVVCDSCSPKKYLTGSELYTQITQLSKTINQEIMKPSVVVLLIKNPLENFIYFNALLLSSHCVVTLDTNVSREDLESTIKTTHAQAIIVDQSDQVLHNLEQISSTSHTLPLIQATERYTIKKINDGKNVNRANIVNDLPFPSMIYRSSGSTGQPKNIIISVSAMIGVIELYRSELEDEGFSSVLSILPLSAIYPMSICLATILNGKKLTFADVVSTPLADLIRQSNAEVIPAVPLLVEKIYEGVTTEINTLSWVMQKLILSMISLCYNLRKLTGVNVGRYVFAFVHNKSGPSLKVILSGGASIKTSELKSMHGLGYTIYEGYGITETAGMVTIRKNQLNNLGSVGKPIGGCEIMISDEQEILVKTPQIFYGYVNEASVDLHQKAWFHTGDIGLIDSDGYIYISGRLKDIIVLKNEQKVLPVEIEKLYVEISKYTNFVALGLIDEQYSGDKIVLVLETMDEQIINQINPIIDNAKVDSLMKPVAVFAIEQLPRTMLGKVDKHRLKQALVAGEVQTI